MNEQTLTLDSELTALIEAVYPAKDALAFSEGLLALGAQWGVSYNVQSSWVNERDAMLITYGDSIYNPGEEPLKALARFYRNYGQQSFSAIHILPCFPFSSDDGFSVEDYHQINPELGDWNDIEALAHRADLMLDAVINHISRWSYWFRRYESGDAAYQDFFIEADPNADYSKVTRPRPHPLLSPFDTAMGRKYVWTTFSDDQIDLNYKNPKVFLAVIEVLVSYARRGARFIRLDAIGFLWKEDGTTCMHLPQTHQCIQIMRRVLDQLCPGTLLISETNVPHQENISYFGNGNNEAHMVYQFPLPPLVLYSFISGDATPLTRWAQHLLPPSGQSTYFNFLASHDGIGLRPTEGLLDMQQRQTLLDTVVQRGGKISWRDNGDGTQSPYELNITYRDALSHPDESHQRKVQRMLASHAILFALQGMPAVYIHSFIGSGNDYKALQDSGINRRINRGHVYYRRLQDRLDDDETLGGKIWRGLSGLLNVRKRHPAFSPSAAQAVHQSDPSLFIVERSCDTETVWCGCNVSLRTRSIGQRIQGYDLLLGIEVELSELKPLEFRWIKVR